MMRSRIGLSFVLVAAAAVVLTSGTCVPGAHLGRDGGRGLPQPARRRPRGAADVQRYPGNHDRRTAGADLAVAGPDRIHPCRLVQLRPPRQPGSSERARIIPELQHLAVGDIVPMSPDGKHGMPVHSIDAPRSMIWGTPGDTTWTWQLDPCPDRLHAADHPGAFTLPVALPAIAFSALVEFGDVWMMRKMLLNLRDRAEAASP